MEKMMNGFGEYFEFDIEILVKEMFGIDVDMVVFVFFELNEYVFDFDDMYCFDCDIMLVILVGFKYNCCVMI